MLTLTNVTSNFAGGVSIKAGTVSVSSALDGGAPGQLGMSTAPIPLGDTATTGTLQYTGNTVTTTRAFTLAAGGGALEVTTAGQQLTIGGTVTNGSAPLSLLGSGNGVLNLALPGPGNVTKTGTGTWTLAGVNAPSGASVGTTYDLQAGGLAGVSNGTINPFGGAAISVEAGTLGLSTTAPATFDNAVSIAQNATINAFQSPAGGALAGQTVTLGGTNNVTIAAGATATLTTADNYTLNFAGNLTGAGAVAANGTVNLNGSANNYSGSTTVNGGAFAVNGALNTSGAITVNNAATFTANGAVSAAAITVNNTSTFTAAQPTTATGAILVNGGTFTANAPVNAASVTISAGAYNGNAALTNPGGLTLSGGTAVITAPGGLGTGPLTVTGGTLQVAPGASNAVNFGGAMNVDGLLQASSGTLNLGNTVITTTKPHNTPAAVDQLAEVFFTPANAGVADFLSGANGDPLITFENNNNFLTRAPGATGLLQNTPLTFAGAALQGRANGLFGTGVTDNEGAAWFGQITVGGTNLPAGQISFSTNSDDGSSLYIDSNQDGIFQANERVVANLGTHGATAVTSTVTLNAGTYNIAIGYYNGGGSAQMDARFAPGTNVAIASEVFINPGDPTQAGVFSSLPVLGSQIEIDSGATVNAGGFTVANVVFGAGASGSTLALADQAAPAASVADAITLQGSATQATVNFGANQTVTVAALNLGTGGVLTKSGNGTLAVIGAGTGTGTVTIAGGALLVSGSISGTVTISGGTLGGTGTVPGVTLVSGKIAPGIAGPGILNTADLTLNGGVLAIEINGPTPGTGAGNYDQINVTGGVTFNAPIALSLDFSGYDPQDNVDSFVIVNDDQADPITFNGTTSRLFFNGAELDEGTIFMATSGSNSQFFQVSYVGSSGNDIVLNAIPEPGTLAGLLSGLGMLAGLQRFRRRR